MTSRKTAQSINTTYQKFTLLTQKLCLQRLVVTDISSDFTLKHPFCPSKSAKLSTKLLTCLKARVSHGLFLTFLGECPGREPRRTIPGSGEGRPTTLKKECADHSSSSCTSPSPSPDPQKKPPPPPTVVLTVLRIRADTRHPQLFTEVLSLPFPPHYTQRQDDTCTALFTAAQRSVKHALEILKAHQWAEGIPACTAPLRG